MVEREVEVLIIGGGLIGATLMLALQQIGLSALLVEARSFGDKADPNFDARSLALSPASQRILKGLGCWDLIQKDVTPINLIHISDQYHFGSTRLQDTKPLGYTIEMHYINQALHQLLPEEQILAPATLIAIDKEAKQALVRTEQGECRINFQLLVAADGADSTVRQLCGLISKEKQYNQHAIVANIGLAEAHLGRAYERFTAHGPLALLPLQDKRMSLVWALPPQKAKELLIADDAVFLRELQRTFGYKLGALTKVGQRSSFPLKQVLTTPQAQWPMVFVGNAAHTLHPVAGQGFNLGLRDVAALAQCLLEQGLTKDMLMHYMSLRSGDQRTVTRMTEGLIHLFTSRIPGVGIARSLGLVFLDNSKALKKVLARYAQGFGGVLPDLVCELALERRSLDHATV